MTAPEYFERFARRAHAALLHVFQALADAFLRIRLRGDIQQALIGFGVLYDGFRLSIDAEGERLFCFLAMTHDLRRIAAGSCRGFERRPKNSEASLAAGLAPESRRTRGDKLVVLDYGAYNWVS